MPRRFWTRSTVTLCHAPPAGVGILTLVQHRSDAASRHSSKLGKDRPQLFGATERLVTLPDAARIEPAKLHALRLLCSKSVLGSLRDQPALFLHEGRMYVQHERDQRQRPVLSR